MPRSVRDEVATATIREDGYAYQAYKAVSLKLSAASALVKRSLRGPYLRPNQPEAGIKDD